MKNKRILVLGGAGFIGSALASQYCKDNEVVVADLCPFEKSVLKRRGVPENQVQYVECDVREKRSVYLLGTKFDYMIHCCAILGIRRVAKESVNTILTNVETVVNALELAQRQEHLSKFLMFSTSEVYGVCAKEPTEEEPAMIEPPTHARWCYAASKTLSEHLAFAYYRERGIPVLIIRPFNVFGEYRVGTNAMTRFLMRAVRGEELVIDGDGNQVRAWCHIDDFTDGVILAMESEYVGEIFNIGNSANIVTIKELAEKIVAITHSLSSIRVTYSSEQDVKYRSVNTEKAERMLGYKPRISLDEGIRRMYFHLSEKGC